MRVIVRIREVLRRRRKRRPEDGRIKLKTHRKGWRTLIFPVVWMRKSAVKRKLMVIITRIMNSYCQMKEKGQENDVKIVNTKITMMKMRILVVLIRMILRSILLRIVRMVGQLLNDDVKENYKLWLMVVVVLD